MPEPVTAIGLGVIAAYLSKGGVEKLLGPTAEYLGGGLRDIAQKRIENIGKIFQNAQKKLGDKINQPGEVPPRVLKSILDEGSFCDDGLAAEYLGGVLASSRTHLGRDDRGARVSKLLSGLSTYQIRTHYLIYSTAKILFSGKGLDINMNGRPKMQMFFPFREYAEAMDITEAESKQFEQIISHVFFGLHVEGLIEGHWQYGAKEHILNVFPDAPTGGIICQPSALGTELFLWAFGKAEHPLMYIFDDEFVPHIDGIPNGCSGVLVTKSTSDAE